MPDRTLEDFRQDPQPGDPRLHKRGVKWIVFRRVTGRRLGDGLVTFQEGDRGRSVTLKSWRCWAKDATVEGADDAA